MSVLAPVVPQVPIPALPSLRQSMPQRPLHFLNVISSVNPAHGGPGEGLRQYAQAVRQLGHTLDVVTLDGGSDAWVQSFPATMHALGPVTSKYGYTPDLVPWLKAHAHEYDAVIIHGLWQYHGLAVWRALHGSKTPYFIFFHGMLDPWFKKAYPLKHLKKWLYWPWAEYRIIRDAKAVLCTAEEEARLAPQSFWLYRANAVVVGYGLNAAPEIAPGQAATFLEKFPQLHGKRLMLFLARIHPKKGCDLLIEAFAQVAHQDPTLQLVMAGPDQTGLRAELETLAARLGIPERITWTGMIKGDMKWGALQAAEVFVLSSHQENFGIAVAEAMAVGVPVLISTQVNIWREIVAGQAGFAEADTLAGTCLLLQRWLALDADERQRMGRNAEQCYRQHFHIENAAQRLITTLQKYMPLAKV